MSVCSAEVLRAALVVGGVADDPMFQDGTRWPCFVGHLPPEPDQAICVYRTTGTREGRIMPSGESVRKYGFQIRVRAADYATAWARVDMLLAYLDTIRMLEVVVDGQTRTIASVTQTGDALDLGQEPDAKRRNNVTINGTMTL